MKKRLAALALAGVMAVGLCACSSSSDTTSTTAAAGETAAASGETAAAGEFSTTSTWKPSGTVNVVVPASAGGGTDLCARVFCQYAKEVTGIDYIVTNANGSAGSIAANQVLSSANDGMTFLFGHNLVNVAYVAGVTDYDYTAFTAGPNFAKDPAQQLYVNAEKYSDLDSFIADAQANPGSLKCAVEVGAYTYYEFLGFQQAAGIEMKQIDAGSNSDKITAMLGGQVDMMPGSWGTVGSYVESGQFYCLGAPLEEENELLPGVKTFKEQGIDFVYPDCDYSFYFPADTDAQVIQYFDDLVAYLCEMDDVKAQLNDLYVAPYYLSSADAAANDAAYLETFQTLAASVQ